MYFRTIVFGAGIVAALGMGIAAHAQETNSLEAIRRAAQAELSAPVEQERSEEIFTAGSLGLQSLNPEISVTGDFLWRYADESEQKSDFIFRTLGIHFEAYLDPYTRFKAAVGISEEGAELGEAYITRFGVLPDVNITLGKFRQQFGTVNRWHKHALDQVDFPLALRSVFGPGGLNQSGVSVDWIVPDIIPLQQEVTVQVTDGSNPGVFNQNSENTPSVLARYKTYRDLSASTYADMGLSLLYGSNNEWTNSTATAYGEERLDTWVAGADFTLLWEPTDNMRYRNLVWRNEIYALSKDLLAPDGSGEDSIHAWGLFSYLEGKISRSLVMGVRGDYFVPDTKPYTLAAAPGLPGQAVTATDPNRWQIGPYLTWNQSPFVHFRAEYNYQAGSGTGPSENIFWLQCVFAAGPHKHERY